MTAPVTGIGMVVPGGLKSKKKLYEGDVVVEHGVICARRRTDLFQK